MRYGMALSCIGMGSTNETWTALGAPLPRPRLERNKGGVAPPARSFCYFQGVRSRCVRWAKSMVYGMVPYHTIWYV